MEPFDSEDLRAFAMIAAAGGLSAASRAFSRPKATLSRSLSKLEAAAGSPLFDRVSRGLRLTPAGELLEPAAAATLSASRDAQELLRRLDGEPSGPLRIAASALTGQLLLAQVLARLIERHPAIEPHLMVTSTGPDPLAEGLDVVVRVGRPDEPYLVTRRIAVGRFRLYVPSRTRVNLDDATAVERLGRVVIAVGSVPQMWTLSRQKRTVQMASPARVAVGDPLIALAYLRHADGVAMLPDVYADPLVRAGELVRALPEWSGPTIELFATLPPKRALVPAVRAFLDLLVETASVEHRWTTTMPDLPPSAAS